MIDIDRNPISTAIDRPPTRTLERCLERDRSWVAATRPRLVPAGGTAADPRRTAACARRLNADWDTYRARPVPVPWRRFRLLDGCRALDDVLGRIGGDRSIPVTQADTALAVVVRLAAQDEVAARVVLQRLLPGLVIVARRRASDTNVPTVAVLADLVAEAWIAIRTYPSERRPTKVAANLLRDTEYNVFTRPARRKSATEHPVAPADGADAVANAAGQRVDNIAPASEVAALLGHARQAGVAVTDIELVHRLHLRGESLVTVGAALNLTTRTIRNRRRAAIAAIASTAA